MHKGIVGLGSTALTVAAIAIVMACGDSSGDSEFPPGDDDSGSFDAGGIINTGDGAAIPGKEAAAVDCNPRLPTTFTPAFKKPTRSEACAAEDFTGYYESCLDPLDATKCKAWREAHAACAACIEPEDKSGPIQQHLERYYATTNLAGCISIERQEVDAGSCAVAYWDAIQCQRDSCTTCLPTEGATFQDYSACQREAKTSACTGYENKFQSACGSTYNDFDGGAYDCFVRASDTDKDGKGCTTQGAGPCKSHYLRLMARFCGAVE